MKPFYDTYYGPFKDKHHYWVGVLLIIRAMVQLIITLSFTIQPYISVLAAIVIFACLLMYTAQTGGLYKKWYVSLLDTSFYLNLTIFAGGIFYSELTGSQYKTVGAVSLGIAQLQFLIIVVGHICYTI